MSILEEIWNFTTEIKINKEHYYLDKELKESFKMKYKIWELMPFVDKIVLPNNLNIERLFDEYYAYYPEKVNTKTMGRLEEQIYFYSDMEFRRWSAGVALKIKPFKTESLFEIYTLVKEMI